MDDHVTTYTLFFKVQNNTSVAQHNTSVLVTWMFLLLASHTVGQTTESLGSPRSSNLSTTTDLEQASSRLIMAWQTPFLFEICIVQTSNSKSLLVGSADIIRCSYLLLPTLTNWLEYYTNWYWHNISSCWWSWCYVSLYMSLYMWIETSRSSRSWLGKWILGSDI